MKLLKALILLVILGTQLLLSSPQEGWDKDNYGKAIIQLIDNQTNKPVVEAFRIYLYDSNNEDITSNRIETVDTNVSGYCEVKLLPFKYRMQIHPLAENSKYCMSPYPFFVDNHHKIAFIIKKGEVTYVQRMVELGGILEVYTTDITGKRFNPAQIFDAPFNISVRINSFNYYGPIINKKDSLNNGSFRIGNLYPGKYSVELGFRGLGYQDITIDEVTVAAGKKVEVEAKMDVNDQTGIEGIVTDIDGLQLENVKIFFSPVDKTVKGDFVTISDSNGYFKLSGMPAGTYRYFYHFCKDTKKTGIYIGTKPISITKNHIQELKIMFKYSKNQLEGIIDED